MKSNPAEWLFGIVVLAVGVANLALVHPVPGLACVIVSLGYLPLANVILKNRSGVSIPNVMKVLPGHRHHHVYFGRERPR